MQVSLIPTELLHFAAYLSVPLITAIVLAEVSGGFRLVYGSSPTEVVLRYVSKTEETHGQQATETRRDCHEVAAG